MLPKQHATYQFMFIRQEKPLTMIFTFWSKYVLTTLGTTKMTSKNPIDQEHCKSSNATTRLSV